MPSPELKPCPFCGGSVGHYTRHASYFEKSVSCDDPWYATEILCSDCGAIVRFYQFFKRGIRHETAMAKTRRLSVAAWNRRAGEEKEATKAYWEKFI